ncbi:kielin/chordin-like protein [Glandiceps talaboti]
MFTDECPPVLNPDPCQECTCVQGRWNCVDKDCPLVVCSHPVQGECCPECTACLYEGTQYRSTQTFPHPRDQCQICRCLDGSVECIRRVCQSADCNNPRQNQCGCPSCQGCEYLGQEYRNDETFDDPRQACFVCQCEDGDVTCQQKTCQPVQCRNPSIGIGECCPVCPDVCEVDGVTYQDGETWRTTDDSCQQCVCRNGDISCRDIECLRRCSHPQQIVGECCPVCLGCTYEGIDYNDGELFTPPSDDCNRCQCLVGNVICTSVTCPRLDCQNPLTINGECCQRCPGCVHNGQVYDDGFQWRSTTDNCEECLCMGIEAQCHRLRCPPVTCTHPVQGDCCDSCEACQFNNVQYPLGDVFKPDDCTNCLCQNGNVQCDVIDCPILTCPFKVKDPGQCCERCRAQLSQEINFQTKQTYDAI